MKKYAGCEHLMISINEAEDRIDNYLIKLEKRINGEEEDSG